MRPVKNRKQRALNSHLDQATTVESSFPSGPSLSKDKTHIIVATPERMLYTLLYPISLILMSVLELLEDLDDPHDVSQRKVKEGVHRTEISYLSYACALALDQSLDRLNFKSSPSEIVHSADKVASLLDDKSPIRLNEPPAAIFNPALAGLQRHLENLKRSQSLSDRC